MSEFNESLFSVTLKSRPEPERYLGFQGFYFVFFYCKFLNYVKSDILFQYVYICSRQPTICRRDF